VWFLDGQRTDDGPTDARGGGTAIDLVAAAVDADAGKVIIVLMRINLLHI